MLSTKFMLSYVLTCLGRGVEIKNFLLVQGQVKSQNVLVHRIFYLSKRKNLCLENYLFFQKQYETRSTLVNRMDPGQLASLV